MTKKKDTNQLDRAKDGDRKADRAKGTRSHERIATGSDSEDFQQELIGQVIGTIWTPNSKAESKKYGSILAALDAMAGIAPRDELEGMLAAQMVATHNVAMELIRRGMLENQHFEGIDQSLKHAAKFLALFERQLSALDKRRGKGRQKITVEHVNVHAGGQAIVGTVRTEAMAETRSAAPKSANAQQALEDGSDASLDGDQLKQALASKKALAPKRKTR